MSYWEAHKAADTAALVDNMVEIGSHLRARREQKLAQRAFQDGYARALEDAKRFGNMPE